MCEFREKINTAPVTGVTYSSEFDDGIIKIPKRVTVQASAWQRLAIPREVSRREKIENESAEATELEEKLFPPKPPSKNKYTRPSIRSKLNQKIADISNNPQRLEEIREYRNRITAVCGPMLDYQIKVKEGYYSPFTKDERKYPSFRFINLFLFFFNYSL